MKAKLGMLVTEASGSLGGHTFQNSKGGFQIRTKPVPRGNPSASQISIRSINQQLQAGWRALTPAQQKIWNLWPVTHGIMNAKGDKSPLSGHSLWMQLNFANLYAGDPLWHQPYGPDPIPYGPELIVNGTFVSDTGWPVKNYSSIHDGRAYLVSQFGQYPYIGQSIASLLPGSTYRFTCDVYDLVGLVSVFIPASFYFLSNGHNDILISTFVTGLNFYFYGYTIGGSCSVDNASLKKVI